jgi:type IV pilus assembly protein PilX
MNTVVIPLSNRQCGATLVTSLLLLLVLTIIGVSAMQITRMQERMAGNARDLNLAFQSGEAALRDGENTLYVAGTTTGVRPAACNALAPGCAAFAPTILPPLGAQNQAWWTTNSRDYDSAATNDLDGVARDPQFVIEELGDVECDGVGIESGECTRTFYRVTTRATGASATTSVVLQSTYAYVF